MHIKPKLVFALLLSVFISSLYFISDSNNKTNLAFTELNHLLDKSNLSQRAQVVSSNGLVSSFSFDEGSGTSVLDSSSGVTGTLKNGVQFVTGNNNTGKGLQFDGVDDSVSFSNSAPYNITGPLSISFWIKGTASMSPNKAIVVKGKLGGTTNEIQYLVSTWIGNTVVFRMSNGSQTMLVPSGSSVISSSAWSHVVATYNGSDTATV